MSSSLSDVPRTEGPHIGDMIEYGSHGKIIEVAPDGRLVIEAPNGDLAWRYPDEVVILKDATTWNAPGRLRHQLPDTP